MDPFALHVAALPRSFPHRCPLSSSGYIPRKREWINREFATMNFSFSAVFLWLTAGLCLASWFAFA